MSERLTVVFDDEDLYRRLKVTAARRGQPAKQLIEDAVRSYLGEDLDSRPPKPFDWAQFEEWQSEVDALDADAGDGAPANLSAITGHRYEVAEQGPALRIAEGRTEYDSR
ncbi:MAG: hypothetical protein HYX53_00105 [Chloroflexi bacterium]|nr:hypothetical protein [Chloroflexota bacterium]